MADDCLNGMPDSATYDKAVAVAQLVLGRLRPFVAMATDTLSSGSDLPKPPILSAGLTTPLPASLTGDARTVNKEALEQSAYEAWDALEMLVGDGWALGAT
jgi:metaxin